ncbi:MAG: hypothetical protein ACW96U_00705 [Candidatus Heimdallarchaeaceae archaeon]|jgi:hypothetical protein
MNYTYKDIFRVIDAVAARIRITGSDYFGNDYYLNCVAEKFMDGKPSEQMVGLWINGYRDWHDNPWVNCLSLKSFSELKPLFEPYLPEITKANLTRILRQYRNDYEEGALKRYKKKRVLNWDYDMFYIDKHKDRLLPMEESAHYRPYEKYREFFERILHKRYNNEQKKIEYDGRRELYVKPVGESQFYAWIKDTKITIALYKSGYYYELLA